MHNPKRFALMAVGFWLAACATIGCGKKDATETAAPPPSSNAVAEPGVQKNLPANTAAPAGNGGASGTQQVFKN